MKIVTILCFGSLFVFAILAAPGGKQKEETTVEAETKNSCDQKEAQSTVDGDSSPEFIGALQRFAQATARKGLADLEAEFRRLEAMPMPERSDEFRNNHSSNRYEDVLCAEPSRVKLANGRYIHANWIHSNGQRPFICTQAPLPTTCDDFWTMIVQERVEAIVILCESIELKRKRCYQYWPTKEAKTALFANGSIAVTYLQEDQVDDGIYETQYNVATADKEFVVRHFHWRQWPDHKVPSTDVGALRLLNVVQPYSPVVVHCSAGIGRTGTLVAIYLALRRLRAGQDLDIAELIQELRKQRSHSVQSLEQYLYIYNVILRFTVDMTSSNNPSIRNDIETLNNLVDQIKERIHKKGSVRN